MKQLLLIVTSFLLMIQLTVGQNSDYLFDSQENAPEDTEQMSTIGDEPAQVLSFDNNHFKIILPCIAPGSAVAIYDLLGNVVAEEPFGTRKDLELDLSSEKHGVYFLKVSQPGQMITKRIVVK